MSVKQTENRRRAPHSAWKPGQSGNPKGRPRLGNSLAECLREYLDAPDRSKRIRKEALVAKLYQASIGINPVPAARLIFEIMGGLHVEDQLAALLEKLEGLEGAR